MNDTTIPLTHAEIRRHIQSAAEEVFSTMLGLEIEAREMSLRDCNPHSGVTALLGLTGDWTGSGQVSCDSALACSVASAFLMAEYPEVNDEVLDALGELANMIIGNVKTALEHQLGPMGLSTPVIVSGGEFETRILGSPAWIAVSFACEAGNMSVQIVLSPARRPVTRMRQIHSVPAQTPELTAAG